MSGETESNVSGWTTDTLHLHVTKLLEHCASIEEMAVLKAQVAAIGELMEAKFVTFRVLVESQADKVKLALDASQEAINVANVATEKAIDKAAESTDSRFAAALAAHQSLADQLRLLMPRIEVDAAIGRNTERINEVAARLERAEHS